MSRLRLLLDENVPAAIELALRRRIAGVEVLLVGEPGAPPKGTPDPGLLKLCERAGLALVTLDRRTMPDHFAAHLAAGDHSPGVFVIRRNAVLSAAIDDLVLILEVTDAEEWIDRLEYLPY